MGGAGRPPTNRVIGGVPPGPLMAWGDACLRGILGPATLRPPLGSSEWRYATATIPSDTEDRKSTRLNSSHTVISYAVFCLKKKKKIIPRLHLLEKNTYTPFNGGPEVAVKL